ncbi:MAG: AbrB-like transcriptional regulator [Cyanobium sp.]
MSTLTATVQFKGNLLVLKSYAGPFELKPEDKFEIKLSHMCPIDEKE